MWMVLLLAHLQPARACRPEPRPYVQTLVPSDGTTGFPTDGAIRVLTSGLGAREVVPGLALEYRLRGPDGEPVAWTAQVRDLLLTLVPDAALRPEAPYIIERKYPYKGGLLLTDRARMDIVLLSMKVAIGSDLRLRWYPTARFTTAAGPESRPPQSTAQVSAKWGDAGSCGPGEAVHASASWPAGALATDLYMLEVRDQDAVGFRTVNPQHQHAAIGIGHHLSDPTGPHIEVEPDPEVRMSLLTAAGARLGTSDWVVASPLYGGGAHRPISFPHGRLSVRGFFESVTDDSPASAPAGPERCPFGLVATEIALEGVTEAISRYEAVEGGRWRLRWMPDGLNLFYRGEERSRFRFRVAGTRNPAAVTARHTLREVSRVLGLRGADEPTVALARSGGGSVVAWVTEDRVQVAWLYRARVTTGPFVLPATIRHANGGVAVVERDGLAVVAWGDDRSGGWRVAVVDRSGRYSPSLAQHHGYSFALGVVGRETVAADIPWLSTRPRALRLDCGSEAPFGAPDVLAQE